MSQDYCEKCQYPLKKPDYHTCLPKPQGILRGERFEQALRHQTHLAGMGIQGHSIPPWEIINEYIIMLEKRIARLEKDLKE